MEEKQTDEKVEDNYPAVITPWFILDIIKPFIREEFIAICRYDRTGIRMKFLNGQKFHLTVTEVK